MTKAQKDKYWMDCIQQCRVSGLSDQASDVPVPVSKVAVKQEVVPIHYNELPETKAVNP